MQVVKGPLDESIRRGGIVNVSLGRSCGESRFAESRANCCPVFADSRESLVECSEDIRRLRWSSRGRVRGRRRRTWRRASGKWSSGFGGVVCPTAQSYQDEDCVMMSAHDSGPLMDRPLTWATGPSAQLAADESPVPARGSVPHLTTPRARGSTRGEPNRSTCRCRTWRKRAAGRTRPCWRRCTSSRTSHVVRRGQPAR